MVKTYTVGQVVEISSADIKLSLFKNFLILSNANSKLATIPLPNITAIMVSNPAFVITGQIATQLASNNIPVFLCNNFYLPYAIISPLYYHYKHKQVLHNQLNVTLPFIKQCWQAIVKQKVYNSALILKHFNIPQHTTLLNLSNNVLSADSTFIESQAAKIYFNALFGDSFLRQSTPAHTATNNAINIMLNYGYSVVRSAMARALIGAGLNTAFGLYHKNLYNPYCLVDDLMEPYRCLVDLTVKNIINHSKNITQLTPQLKQQLVGVLYIDLLHNNKNTPLVNVCTFLAQSYSNSIQSKNVELNFSNLKI